LIVTGAAYILTLWKVVQERTCRIWVNPGEFMQVPV
jgi:hypothetical protein